MDKRIFRLVHREARARAVECVASAPEGYVVTVAEPTRSLDQNAAQWPILEAFAQQKRWSVNGQLCSLTAEEWKDTLTASFQSTTVRMAPLVGQPGVVILGLRTSTMGKQRFSEWLDYLQSVAAELGVELHERAPA